MEINERCHSTLSEWCIGQRTTEHPWRRRASRGLLSSAQCSSHFSNQAIWTHVCPMLVYIIKALAATGRPNYCPTSCNYDKRRPNRILSLVIDQDMEATIFVF